jgi:hypothetical protein
MPSGDANAPDQGRRMSRRSLPAGPLPPVPLVLPLPLSERARARPWPPPAVRAGGEPERGRTDAGPTVVHVRDGRSGDIEVFPGTSQTRLRDGPVRPDRHGISA